MSAATFKEKLSQLGSRLSASTGRDAIYGGLETLSKRFAPSAELLRLVVVSPRFDADAVERVRAQHLTDLARAANEPTRLALDRWYVEAFPGHPYGRSVGRHARDRSRGSRVVISRQCTQTCLPGTSCRVVIVGDIDKRAAADALDAIFGGLPEKAKSKARREDRPTCPAGAGRHRQGLPTRHGDLRSPLAAIRSIRTSRRCRCSITSSAAATSTRG